MKSLLERGISLPLKAVIVGLLCGLVIWAVLDLIAATKLQTMLVKQLTEHLHEEASRNRILFDRYVKQHTRAVKLLAMHQPLVQWLQQLDNNEPAPDPRHYRKQRPPWFPSISAWRGLIDPRHVLLQDSQERFREVYHVRDADLPGAVFSDSLLTTLSQNQAYLTRLDGYPYLLTSAPVTDSQDQRWGKLVLITPLDDQFLTKLHYSTSHTGPILALIEETEGRVLASSDPDRFSAGSAVENMHQDYLVTGDPFFDYGASDLRLRLATFLPKVQVTALNEKVLTLVRRHHLIAAIIFITSFTLLIFLLSQRINQLILRITAFAQETLGSKQTPPAWGNQLDYLDARINVLMEEVMAARDAMHLRYETEHKSKQLSVLEAVTQELGIGILFLSKRGEEPIRNHRMSEFEAEYGKGWYAVDKSSQCGDVELKNRRHELRILQLDYMSLADIGDVILVRDATEKRQSHRILQESEERFRNIAQSAHDAIISMNIAGNIISYNKAAMRIFGYSESEVLGRPLTQLIPPQYRHAHEAGLERLRAGGSSRVIRRTLELEGLRKDGTSFPLAMSLSTWTIEGARYFTGILRDITQPKQAEQEIREKQQLLAHIIENIPHSIFWKDKNSVFLGCNRNFAEEAGLQDPENIVGKTDYDLAWKKQETDFFRKIDKQVMESGKAQLAIEEPQRRADGTEATLLTSKVPLRDATGQIIGILGIYADITERKEQEAQLLQAQKMEVMGQLAGGIAHDFNNLLTIVRGNLEVLKKTIVRDIDPETVELLDDALSAARDGTDLIQRLSKLSRKQTVQAQWIDLNKTARDLKKFLRRILRQSFKLKFNLSAEVVMVFVDSSQLENSLLNLAVNARDAMPEGGTLTIDIARQYLEPADAASLDLTAGCYAVISITDSGTGMAPEIIPHAIEPFFTTKLPGKGTGLGLSMVYSFVKQSGGNLRLESTLGKGTTVSLLLPEGTPSAQTESMEMDLKHLPGGSETILVVEDEPRIRKLATRSLTNLGYQVIAAQNARAAKQIIAGGKPIHLLFSDIVMPGKMDGYQLAHWALERQPELKVLITTGGSSARSHKHERTNNGNLPLLHKPYSEETLAETIRALLDQ